MVVGSSLKFSHVTSSCFGLLEFHTIHQPLWHVKELSMPCKTASKCLRASRCYSLVSTVRSDLYTNVCETFSMLNNILQFVAFLLFLADF